tara:strand:- start:12835 stop:13314 length:480 start_codon:yes stop_codon:yes gene_type:complete
VAFRKLKIASEITEFDSIEELPESIQKMIYLSKEVSQTAYAPYSNFKVGSSVLLENGEIITGSNQENSAYPSGLCAERVALFSANSKYPNVPVKAVVVYGSKGGEKAVDPVAPCGACRQVISEYEDLAGMKIDLYMAGESRVILAKGIESLLPMRFRLL